ncbi:hypothetical protein EYF80_009063 [Liparis tanakae]|uniref:Uncharacterized protein n=1 Tax=Liparis tanakae TaxID=230148 RepID=A0A4Z2ITS7_9TELE|nr:hypothetical protein EYF80_009063 [Liparis tanakae]
MILIESVGCKRGPAEQQGNTLLLDIKLSASSQELRLQVRGGSEARSSPAFYPWPCLLGPASWALPPGPCLLGPTSWALPSWALPPGPSLLGSASWALPPRPSLLGSASWALPAGPRLLGSASWALQYSRKPSHFLKPAHRHPPDALSAFSRPSHHTSTLSHSPLPCPAVDPFPPIPVAKPSPHTCSISSHYPHQPGSHRVRRHRAARTERRSRGETSEQSELTQLLDARVEISQLEQQKRSKNINVEKDRNKKLNELTLNGNGSVQSELRWKTCGVKRPLFGM